MAKVKLSPMEKRAVVIMAKAAVGEVSDEQLDTALDVLGFNSEDARKAVVEKAAEALSPKN